MSLFPEVSQGINNSNHLTVFMTSSVKDQLGLQQEHSSFPPPQQRSCTHAPSTQKFLSQQTKIYSDSISHPTTLTSLQHALSCCQIQSYFKKYVNLNQ